LPIERPGLALGGIGNKMKEWQNQNEGMAKWFDSK
jgi:hypothetical protein